MDRKSSTRTKSLHWGLIAVAMIATLCVTGAYAQKTTETIKGQHTVDTQVTNSEVLYVDGNNVVVRMEDGRVEHFTVPDHWKFHVDGQELEASQLQPGTKLTTTVTSTTTPEIVRTTTIRSGRVWHVMGNTVIVAMDDTKKNEKFVVPDWYKFTINGQPTDVHHLKKGMQITGAKVVEVPKTSTAIAMKHSGTAPPPPPKEMAKAEVPAAAPAPEPAPAHLPKTGTFLPLIGLLGFASSGASMVMRMIRK